MAKLLIWGHATRGKEVIEILEMLGAKNTCNYIGRTPNYVYGINEQGIIDLYMSFPSSSVSLFTLEKFLEKHPFKVGDKVLIPEYESEVRICKMQWDSLCNYVEYMVCCNDDEEWYCAEELLKYNNGFLDDKEETMEEKNKAKVPKLIGQDYSGKRFEYKLPDGYIFKDGNGNEIHTLKIVLEKANTLKKIQSNNMKTETNRGYCTNEEETTGESKKVAWFTFEDNDFADKVELALSNRELIQEDGKWFVVKKKKEYPKTYEECLNVLYCKSVIKTIIGHKAELLFNLEKLLICRDAYWKIAGEQMGLGKPWEPDWTNTNSNKYCIYYVANEIKKQPMLEVHHFLSFPTAEMRDAFYENFKELIESCKELL